MSIFGGKVTFSQSDEVGNKSTVSVSETGDMTVGAAASARVGHAQVSVGVNFDVNDREVSANLAAKNGIVRGGLKGHFNLETGDYGANLTGGVGDKFQVRGIEFEAGLNGAVGVEVQSHENGHFTKTWTAQVSGALSAAVAEEKDAPKVGGSGKIFEFVVATTYDQEGKVIDSDVSMHILGWDAMSDAYLTDKMVTTSYGSGRILNDGSGYSAINDGRGIEIRVGNEYNELDELSHLNATAGAPYMQVGDSPFAVTPASDSLTDQLQAAAQFAAESAARQEAAVAWRHNNDDDDDDGVSYYSYNGDSNDDGAWDYSPNTMVSEVQYEVATTAWGQPATVTEVTYVNGSSTTTVTDSSGSGTYTTTTNTGFSVTYTMTNGAADPPVILDLDGDGIEVSTAFDAAFDYDGDGFRERTAWAGADDGFLVIDLGANGQRGAADGKIDQRKELVLSAWNEAGGTDLQAIAEARDANGNPLFDTNQDGKLTAADAAYGEFRVWRDANQDGDVDAGELKTLAEMGISEIGLRHNTGLSYDDPADDGDTRFAAIRGFADMVVNGELREAAVGDVELYRDEFGWKREETATGHRIVFEEGLVSQQFEFDATRGNYNAGNDANDVKSVIGNDLGNFINAAGKGETVYLDGGAGADTLWGGAGADVLVGGDGRDIIRANGGDDAVFAEAHDATFGGDGYDRLTIVDDGGLLWGDVAVRGFEVIYAGDGRDVLNGLDDEVDYGFYGAGGNDAFATAGGADVLDGGDGADVLAAFGGDDRLFGGTGHDTLDGGAGADILTGGAGNDSLMGGAGADYYVYARGDGADRISDEAEGDVLAYNAYLETNKYGSGKGADWVTETRTGYTTATGEVDGGVDTLRFGAGLAIEDVMLFRYGGDAMIRLRAEDDAATAQDESDAYDPGQFVLVEGWMDPRNRIEAFEFEDGTSLDVSQIESGWISHGAASVMTGGLGADWINAGGGADTIDGGAGGDILIAGDGADSVNGGTEADHLYGGEGNDTLRGDDGDDYLKGGDGADRMFGGMGDDALSGDKGNDLLKGSGGDDTLMGGLGRDTLRGGGGDDQYVYFAGNGRDVIEDYAESLQEIEEPTGELVYESSGKSGRWVEEMRTIERMVQVDGGWDLLQFGFTIQNEDVYVAQDGDDLFIGMREITAPGEEVARAQMTDTITIVDWAVEASRVEELRFGNGAALDLSDMTGFLSGLAAADSLLGGATRDFMSGGEGSDTLRGNAGDDYMMGGGARDHVLGGAGDDDMWGGAGNDVMRGHDGDDYILGGEGNDLIEGHAGADVMTGGAGRDTLRGGEGDDVYNFGRGAGRDLIDESRFQVSQDGATEMVDGWTEDFGLEWMSGKGSGNVWVSETRTGAFAAANEGGGDTLQFGPFIDVNDIALNTTSPELDGDLVVEIVPSGDGAVEDSVTINNWGTAQFRVETFRFLDGVTLDMSNVAVAVTGGESDDVVASTDHVAEGLFWGGAWLAGGMGDDLISSHFANGYIIGGEGTDTLRGGEMDDTYVYSRGDGFDRLSDLGSTEVGEDRMNPGGDKIMFGAGISLEDLILNRVGDEMRVYLGDSNGQTAPLAELDDHIDIVAWHDTARRVELLQFTDGLDFDISAITHTRLGADLLGAATVAAVDDVLAGTSVGDWIDGFAGDDTLTAHGGDDYVFGRRGDDSIHGGVGADILIGGEGDDTIEGGGDFDMLAGGAGHDSLRGGAAIDVLMGDIGADTLNGGDDEDLLIGGQGDDVLEASNGADRYRISHGDGDDRLTGAASHLADDYVVFARGIGLTDLWFERVDDDFEVRVFGSDASVTIEDAFSGANAVKPIAGFVVQGQVLSWADAAARAVATDGLQTLLNQGGRTEGVTTIVEGTAAADTLDGGEASEFLNGMAGNDLLTGGHGDDILAGGAGADTMRGGVGDDVYRVDNAGDRVEEDAAPGVDTVLASVTFSLRDHSQSLENLILTDGDAINGTGNGQGNVITGNTGDNRLNGAWGDDTLIGGAGNDTFVDDNGAERMEGGAGDDLYRVDNLGDTVIEEADEGFDVVHASVSFHLRDHSQHIENLLLTGTGAINGVGNGQTNVITGNGAANSLNGAWGNDTLIGGGGNDFFNDDHGNDVMTGGAGVDTFMFQNWYGHDVITDFSDGVDRFRFVGLAEDGISVTQGATGAVVSYGYGAGTVTLTGVSAGLIGHDDFIFA